MAETYAILTESTRGGDGRWTHDRCGTELLAATVCHSVWDRRFTCAGYGEVQRETVPYCPTCERKPSEVGKPIYV